MTKNNITLETFELYNLRELEKKLKISKEVIIRYREFLKTKNGRLGIKGSKISRKLGLTLGADNLDNIFFSESKSENSVCNSKSN